MRGRDPIGYVVSIESNQVTLNIKDTHKGHLASHRFGVSSVTEVNGFLGVDGGTKILVLRTKSMSFFEPKEIHRTLSTVTQYNLLPLRQITANVIGWLSSQIGQRPLFTVDSLASPSLGAEAYPLSPEELAAIVSPISELEGNLTLGTDCRSGVSLRVDLNDFLARHIAVLGSTGQGKSCFSAALMQQLVRLPSPRIVIFDINGEFEPAFQELSTEEKKITHLGGRVNPYKIPYYALGRHGLSRLFLPSEKTQRPAFAFALESLPYIEWVEDGQGVALADDPDDVCLFDDCRPGNAQESFEAIERLRSRHQLTFASKWPPLAALPALIAESHSIKQTNRGYERDSFLYSNVSPLITRIKRFIDDPLFNDVVDTNGMQSGTSGALDWREAGKELVDDIFGNNNSRWKLHIINLKDVAHDLMPFILGSLLELFAFELFRRGQGNTYPTLLVLEEAHHYLRQLPEDEGMKGNLAYERLAKEGRKYGVGLWISTQRPSEVSDTVLSQCGTWAVFRLTSEYDQRTVGSAAEWIDRIELSRIAGLPRQQALIFGSGIPVPVRIKAPMASPLPKSRDPNFSLWTTAAEFE